jgi:uncharacterized protein (DUF1330 family)
MGFYIEVPQYHNKAQQMVDLYGARVIPQPRSFAPVEGQTLLCVVVNPFFDAIGICYDQHEFDAFADPSDDRPKTWLTIDTNKAKALNSQYARWQEATV